MGLADAIGNLFKRTAKQKILDDEELKEKIKQTVLDTAENQQSTLLAAGSINSLNEQFIDNKMSGNDFIQQQKKRLSRYQEYEIMINKIPEQKRQLTLFHDLIISPEEYRREFLDIQNLNDTSEKDFIIKKSKSKNITNVDNKNEEPETVKINYIEYISSFLKRNKLYKNIKNSIYNQLFKGDGFTLIINPDYVEEVDDFGDYVSNFLYFKSVKPDNVVILQLQGQLFGYILLPDEMGMFELNEEQITINFLLNILNNLGHDTLKNITRNVIVNESIDYLDEELSMLMEQDLDTTNKEMFDTYIKKYENIFKENETIKTNFQINSMRVLKEQDFFSYQSQSGFYSQGTTPSSVQNPQSNSIPFMFQMDLTQYMSGNTNQFGSKSIDDLNKLMEVEPELQKLFQNYSIQYVPPENMQHFRISDYNFYPYGQSILEPQRSIQQMTMLMEYSMILYMLLKQPDRKKYTVDVTGIQKERIPEYLNRVKNKLKVNKTIDFDKGMQENLDLITLLDDYFVQEKNGKPLIDISNVEGGNIQNWTDNLDYWKDKLIQSLGIPPSYIGYDDNISGVQTVLTIQDQRLQRTIIRLQNDINDGINELMYNIFKIQSQFTNRKMNKIDEFIFQEIKQGNIEFSLFKPTTLENSQKQDEIQKKMNVIKDLQNTQDLQIDKLLLKFDIFTEQELNDLREESQYTKEHKNEEEDKNEKKK